MHGQASGRDVIQLLVNSAGVPVFCFVEGSTSTKRLSKWHVNSIFNKCHDMFSELIKGPPVSLHLKESGVPKF